MMEPPSRPATASQLPTLPPGWRSTSSPTRTPAPRDRRSQPGAVPATPRARPSWPTPHRSAAARPRRRVPLGTARPRPRGAAPRPFASRPPRRWTGPRQKWRREHWPARLLPCCYLSLAFSYSMGEFQSRAIY
ncbi:hypothetical protein BC828DRAFT_71234 [Blastocladiella britannica]|nr:hypothetical protein BC828DRAFT_71234 [Blastocladiella britannica]